MDDGSSMRSAIGGVESGEQPEERLKRPGMQMESERLSVKPKRQRERNGKGDRERDRPDNAVKTLCTSCCTYQQKQQQQQQPQPQRRCLSSEGFYLLGKHPVAADGKAPQERR